MTPPLRHHAALYGPKQGRCLVELRPADCADPVPDRWVVHPIRWQQGDKDGWEVAFDPGDVSVLRTGPKLGAEDRRLLGEAGYWVVAGDGEGACLWVADATQLGVARVARVANRRGPSVDSAALGL